jgi:hypothetical protein
MFDAAMMRSIIDIKTFEADVPYPELPGLVTGTSSLAERVGNRSMLGAEWR